jgi:hypothetical protein
MRSAVNGSVSNRGTGSPPTKSGLRTVRTELPMTFQTDIYFANFGMA